MPIRPYRPADRAQVREFLGDERAIDSPSHHIFVLDEPDAKGVVLWVKPDAGEEAYLGPVLLSKGTRRDFYRLAAATCQDALAHGFKKAYFTIHDAQLLALLKRSFRVDPVPSGWAPVTLAGTGGEPVQWDIHVDLEDAWAQLQAVI